MSSSTQFAYRAQKSSGLISGPPDYANLEASIQSETPVKHYAYSADGLQYASASALGVRLHSTSNGESLTTLPVTNAAEIGFSSNASLLSSWERPVKNEDGSQHKNLRIWSTSSGEEIISFSQKSQTGWNLQYTDADEFAARMVSSELHIYKPAAFSEGIHAKLKIEGAASFSLSPGKEPSVAVFVPERKGSPASVKIYGLASVCSNPETQPIAQKTFFKADKITMKWNNAGTSLLFVTQTDVDKTNKSYFGETTGYLLSTRDNYSARIAADKEGPIHDFAWSPNSKEFAVTYGFMPSKTVIFDQRAESVNDFGLSPKNFVLYNPQGRLLLLAGFGNLNGNLQVWDRKTMTKLSEFDASNTSHCEWSPDGRHIMCATLSPRLRVDNGIRIFHWSGNLVHHNLIADLYQASWQPRSPELFPFRQTLTPPPSPQVNASGSSLATPVRDKPLGAYRPPHARGTATPDIFKREDQGGSPAQPRQTNGNVATTSLANLQAKPKARTVPGAAAPAISSNTDKKESSTSRRKKKDTKNGEAVNGSTAPSSVDPSPLPSPGLPSTATSSSKTVVVPPLPMDGTPLSPDDKKRRALIKKLSAIEQLKEKRDKGEKLEKTQERKIDAEAEVRAELAALDVR